MLIVEKQIVECTTCEIVLTKYAYDLNGNPYQNKWCPICGARLKKREREDEEAWIET